MHLPEEIEAVGIEKCWVARWKVSPDVAKRRGAKQRIANRVKEDVGIGVSFEAAIELDMHAAKHERATLDKAMHVVTNARADCH